MPLPTLHGTWVVRGRLGGIRGDVCRQVRSGLEPSGGELSRQNRGIRLQTEEKEIGASRMG